MSSNKGFACLSARLMAAAFMVAVFALGGCSSMFGHDPDHPDHPLSDEQAMAQVIDPAKQIVKVAALQDVSGGFSWESCNDQGEPPYRGRVGVSFAVPAGVDRNAYFDQIAKTMVANGWSAGAPEGKRPFGTAIHKDGVMAIIGLNPGWPEGGSVDLFGECRNMNNHRADSNGFSIKDQLRAG